MVDYPRRVRPSGKAGAVQKAVIASFRELQGTLPERAVKVLHGLIDQLGSLGSQIEKVEADIVAWHKSNDASRRLATIPGVGPITASAMAAALSDATLFGSARQFAAWLGLTPKPHSSGGKERQVGISKQGDGYIRRLLVTGATAVIRFARQSNVATMWAAQLMERRPTRVVTVALANKMARIAWAILARH